MEKQPLLLAVFDLDGTVLDTLDDLARSVNYALAENGFAPRSRQEIRAFVGNGIKNLIRRSLPDEADNNTAERVLGCFKSYYALHCADATKPYPGITDLLRELRARGVKTAVVSNKADDAVQKLAEKYFSGLFDYVAGEKSGIARKPAPDSVAAALSTLEVQKENAVYIGDSEVDILTAKNAGIPCITVLWGFRDEDFLRTNNAQTCVKTVRALSETVFRASLKTQCAQIV